METDRNHLSLSMASTLASSAPSQQSQPQAQVHQQPPASNTNTVEGQDSSSTPTKRGPGRPKGSTKKSLEVDPSSPPKVKRPVGRPRKDGRPAGSVPKVPRGPGRPRKNFPPDFAVNTFPQQHQPQQGQGDQQGWSSLQGMFNNYRLPKEAAASDAAVPAAANDSSTAEQTSASSGTPDTNPNVQQSSKWFPAAPAANAAAASSSSIANALIHPPSMNQSAGPSHLMDSHISTSSALGLADNRDQHMNNASDAHSGPRGLGDASSSIPMAQIPDYILSTIYSLFSRQSTFGLPLPRDVLSTYRAHLGHLSGSHSIAYNALKTFWLPYSPVLFRLVLPRTGPPVKGAHRNSNASHKPSSSSHNNNPTAQSNANGDNQNANRTPVPGDQNFEAHRFFYWDPFYLSLSGPLTCPVCHQAPLAHCGPIRTGPLRVFDLPSSSAPSASGHIHAGLVPAAFYVIGMQYGCSQRACGVRLNSWDSRIVNNLPQVLADEWPVHLESVSSETEQNDSKGLSGDAVSRPLHTLVKSLVQAGTSQQGIREILVKLWNWSDSEKEEDHDEEEEESDDAVEVETNGKNDKEKAAEALFASPYHRLWNAQTAQNQEAEASANASMVNGQRPAKRQKTAESAPVVATVVSAPAPPYSSRLFGTQGTVVGDGGPSGLALQLQPPPEHRTNGTSAANQSPRSQPQPQPQQVQQPQQPQAQVRRQPSQSQLKPNPPARPQPSPRTALAHAHPPHIHTPSPIYPSTSLPNSNTNSPQAGKGTTLSLKRPLESETHHSNPTAGAGPSVPAPAPAQTSPAQPHFTGLAHNSPYLRTLQQQQQQQHPGHPSQQPSHPTHHHPPAPARRDPPLHLHPSLVHANALRFNPQAPLHQHQSLLATAPQTAQPQPLQQQPPQPAPQRRVRHCVKCGRHDCKGKGGSQFCKNPCKDCNGMDCRGRNSKRPNATCREGW